MNLVILLGHLAHSARVKTLESGKVAELRVATTTGYGNLERTEWHTCLVHGLLVERVEEQAARGRLVYIEGSLRSRLWTPTRGKNAGRERWVLEVLVKRVDFLDDKPGKKRDPGQEG